MRKKVEELEAEIEDERQKGEVAHAQQEQKEDVVREMAGKNSKLQDQNKDLQQK